jgi:membrane fusion protein, multidrug efflux system
MRARVLLLLVLLIAGAGGTYWYFARAETAPRTAATGRRAAGLEGGRVPVVPATVGRRDVPIYLDGLGTVQAFNSVVVRSRVEGELQKVFFTEGQEVKEGEVLAQIDPRPFQAQLAQTQAKKNQNEAMLANARREVARYTELKKSNYASQQQLDTWQAQADNLVATVQADQAAIDTAKIQLDYATVVAPISGRVGIRQIDQGNVVRAGDSNGLVVITQMKPISVVFTLPEQTLGSLIDQSRDRQLDVIALDRDNASEITRGTLAVIDNQIDQTTGTVKLKATFANDDLRLWPGKFVNVRLLLTTRKDGIVVPAQVVQRGPKGPFAFVVTPENKVEVRQIKVAQIEGGVALVDEGLAVGERVVADGQSRLQSGTQVVLREEMAPVGAVQPAAASDRPQGPPRRSREGAHRATGAEGSGTPQK